MNGELLTTAFTLHVHKREVYKGGGWGTFPRPAGIQAAQVEGGGVAAGAAVGVLVPLTPALLTGQHICWLHFLTRLAVLPGSVEVVLSICTLMWSGAGKRTFLLGVLVAFRERVYLWGLLIMAARVLVIPPPLLSMALDWPRH